MWKRQQQQQLRKSHSIIGSSPVQAFTPHRSTAKTQRAVSMQMWNITEIPSVSENHPPTTIDNNSSNSSSSESAEVVQRQYSFNYDHLDDDKSTAKLSNNNNNNSLVEKTSPDRLSVTQDNDRKVSLNISLDNLSTISVDSAFKLKQISFLINVRLESRKKADTYNRAAKVRNRVIQPVVDRVPPLMNLKHSKSEPAFNQSRIGYDDVSTSVCRKRKTGAENYSREIQEVRRSLKRVKSDSNCFKNM